GRARRGSGGSQPPGAGGPDHAFRSRRRPDADPRGSRCALQRHQGTGPPTRDQGSGEPPSSRPLRQARGLPRRHLRNLDTGRRVGRIDPPSAVAQLAEQWTVNPLVVGSSPTRGTEPPPGKTPKNPAIAGFFHGEGPLTNSYTTFPESTPLFIADETGMKQT